MWGILAYRKLTPLFQKIGSSQMRDLRVKMVVREENRCLDSQSALDGLRSGRLQQRLAARPLHTVSPWTAWLAVGDGGAQPDRGAGNNMQAPLPVIGWRSDLDYDPTATQWLIDSLSDETTYLSFIRYDERGTPGLPPGCSGAAQGNVITLCPEARPTQDTDPVAVEFLKQHEAQHVIQFYQLGEQFQVEQAHGPKFQLKYEKEACARQVIKGTLKTDVLLQNMVEMLMNYQISERQAKSWIEGVRKTRTYPGVTTPRGN